MANSTDHKAAVLGITAPTADDARIAKKFFDKREVALEPGEMFSTELMLTGTFDNNLPRLGDALGMTLEQQTAERREFSAIVRSAGLQPGVARRIHDAWTTARLAPTAAEDEDDKALLAANAESRRALRDQWGSKDAEDLLQRAQKFARQHPKLNAILSTGGIGSRKDIVQALVEHVRTVNFR